ncbi:MAG: cysteine desulfurase [Bacteroidetes bacterium]|nr:MAG: cysteine desulfurase [Bacteroidota bacterium]
MIYLDYNATTPVDSRVLEAMLPYFSEKFGNAASKTHATGWVAEAAVEQARERVAKLIGATPHEIIFTSGATEAINLAAKGVYEAAVPPFFFGEGRGMRQGEGRGGGAKTHIITLITEHKAVLDTCKYLKTKGAKVTYLPVNREGLIDLDQLRDLITSSTLLVCIMYANNETGVIQPIEEISKIAHEKGCYFMSDATQAVGKINVAVSPFSTRRGAGGEAGGGIDLLCFSSHKIYGPKGAGALYVRRKDPRVTLSPLIHGGGHERGLRSGTLNVPAIVGFGKACEIALQEMETDSIRISQLRNELEKSLLTLGNVSVNGLPSLSGEGKGGRLPNVTNLCFHGIKADSLIAKLPDIAVSTGSACTSAIPEPSHVLKAMGMSDEIAYSSVRFSLGKYTTKEEIEIVSEKVKEKIKEMRK